MGSFRPEDEICVLRSYMRQRDTLVKSASTHVLRMQKALTQMNVQLHHVISDITGVTGLRIICAMLKGERDPAVLARLKDRRIKSNEETIAKALLADYREEHLFVLQQEWDLYQAYRHKIDECEQRISRTLSTFEKKVDVLEKPLPKARARRPQDGALREKLYQMTGVDFTKIHGFDVRTVQAIIAEVGLDMSKWPSEKHFASWLTLCPNNQITGGKIKCSRTKKSANRAAMAFRLAAQALKFSQSALGAYFRRMKSRLGTPMAITATAHKLARIFYRLLKYGQDYVDPGVEAYEEKYRDRLLHHLKTRALNLGYELVLLPQGNPDVS